MTEESRLSVVEDRLSDVNNIITIEDRHPHSSRLGERSKRQLEGWLEGTQVSI
jgi:hypothetical protein